LLHGSWLLLAEPVKCACHRPPQRVLAIQASNDLQAHLSKHRSEPFSAQLADFHLLLWLSMTLHWQDSDIAQIVEAVHEKKPIMEGHKMMIESLAGL
jgi:hypothetical protein